MLSKRERQALEGMAKLSGDFDYLTFRGIARGSGLKLRHVRRTVRALARKGFAEYQKGLCNEDGRFFGSGYRATEAGRAELEAT